MTDFGKRLLKAYGILYPGKPERGAQVWLRRVMGQQTHLRPSKATISRWVAGDRNPWLEGWETLGRIEADAMRVLKKQMRELER